MISGSADAVTATRSPSHHSPGIAQKNRCQDSRACRLRTSGCAPLQGRVRTDGDYRGRPGRRQSLPAVDPRISLKGLCRWVPRAGQGRQTAGGTKHRTSPSSAGSACSAGIRASRCTRSVTGFAGLAQRAQSAQRKEREGDCPRISDEGGRTEDRGQRTEDRRMTSCSPILGVLAPSSLCVLFRAGQSPQRRQD